MSDPSHFRLHVTAGPGYPTGSHREVPVNTEKPLRFSNDHIDASLTVRVQNYRGLPKDSPTTSAYFEAAPHNHDLYSISFAFVPKQDIPGAELFFGNDFDKPIKNQLPPGFNAALSAVRWFVDPGIDGDVYADKPYLFGPLLSSINVLSIGDKGTSIADQAKAPIFEEGGSDEGIQIRSDLSVPTQSSKRMKHFLTEEKRKEFTFEKGREYRCDFFNPYLDFNELALKLPGVSLHLMHFWDGQPLRYVLKRKGPEGEEALLTILFTLMTAEEAEKEAGAQPQADATKSDPAGDKFVDEGVD